MARRLSQSAGAYLTESQIEEMARSSLFQSAVGDLLEKAHRYKDGMENENVSGGTLAETKTNPPRVDGSNADRKSGSS